MFGIKTILGLPVHVLVVHFAVVLVPLSALGLILTGWRPDWRKTFALPLALVAVVGAAAAFTAAQSGSDLRRSLRASALSTGVRADFGSHPGYGNIARIFAMLLAAAAVGLWLNERRAQPWPATALYLAGAGVGVVAIVTMILAGHTGATLVWRDLGNYVSPK